jgi:acyl-coenzyme A synthetase/AMP-(fatty) acid ligase
VAADPAKLMGLLADVGATIVQATPATWRMLIEAGWQSAPGLRVLCGGEALPAELAARLRATGAVVWNVYGPTETTIWSTTHRLEDVVGGAVPIGRPIANTRIYVLDHNGEPVPVGVSGELYIGGAGVARGYLDRPELTQSRFVPDRFAADPAARLYRTGDIVRHRPDGALEFLGRVDHQVKVRGFRIELGEIEAVLARHPAVSEAVVVAREDRPEDRYLAAYLRASGPAPAVAELRAFLRESLPDYMVPSTFTTLATFPLTPNGKVDRKRLPEPDERRVASRAPFLAPRGRTEDALAAVWREVLRLEQVGIDDNFFDLGGHSLLLVQVQAKLRSGLGQDVPIVEMFQYPTIRTMAAHLGRTPVPAGTR